MFVWDHVNCDPLQRDIVNGNSVKIKTSPENIIQVHGFLEKKIEKSYIEHHVEISSLKYLGIQEQLPFVQLCLF